MHNYCDGINRRDAIRIGALGFGGLSLANLLELDAADDSQTKDRNAILIFLTGGQSHIDTWDMKPEAGDMKGEFESIETNVPGFRVCELVRLNAQRDAALPPGLTADWRANGFICLAEVP